MKYILGFCLIAMANFSFAQSDPDTSEFEFFVNLEALTPIDTILDYLEDLNSSEIWDHNSSGLALWQVDSFPFTMADGTEIFNINDVIRRSVRKTKIKESNFNVLSVLGDTTVTDEGSTFDPQDFSINQGTQKTIKISILDTGIDPNIQNSTTEDFNYDLLSYSGYDYVNNDDIPEDEHGHGTHIAGLIHSITNGVDSLGSYIDFDIRKTHDSLGQAYLSNIVKALLDAVDEDANVVNMSFGKKDSFFLSEFYPLRRAIQYANENDVAVVAAAGNESKDIDDFTNSTTPAVFTESNVISVGALMANDSLAAFSNFGQEGVDVGVLGEFIPGPDLNGGIRYASGTSQVAAITSATIALLGTYESNFKPDLIRCSIINGVDPLSGLDNLILAEGKININSSLSLYQNTQTDYTVTNLENSGVGSLRYALEEVCGVVNIFFDPSINGQTISIEDEPLLIDWLIELRGNGQDQTFINGVNTNTINVSHSGNLQLRDVKISNSSGNNDFTIYNKGKLRIKNNVQIE